MTVTVKYEDMQGTLHSLFLALGFRSENALTLATTHTDSTMHGVHSHGINRVLTFVQHVQKGVVDVNAIASKTESFGSIERWDGHVGSGVLNALSCTRRAVELAKQHGLGLVALRNTNHWMRAGTYGALAAKKGCIGILFTNTEANMPPWGGAENRLGNNPLVIAVPHQPAPVVLDMALSQFSFGKVQQYHLNGEKLPFPGGWDRHQRPTDDPNEILESGQVMPSGYWKGSALAMVLDMLATLLTAGSSTCRVSQQEIETGVSQVFMCIDIDILGKPELHQSLLNEIINYTSDVPLVNPDSPVIYPGLRTQQTFARSQQQGMKVDTGIWQNILDVTASLTNK